MTVAEPLSGFQQVFVTGLSCLVSFLLFRILQLERIGFVL